MRIRSQKDSSIIFFPTARGTLELSAEHQSDMKTGRLLWIVPLSCWMVIERSESAPLRIAPYQADQHTDAEISEIAQALSQELKLMNQDHVILSREESRPIPSETREKDLAGYRNWMEANGWSVTYDLRRRELSRERIAELPNKLADIMVSISRERILHETRAALMLSGRYCEEKILAKSAGVFYLPQQEVVFSDMQELLAR